VSVVLTYYYTDPACPWSWALEPTLRRLTYELGDTLRLTYVMSGMAREFGERTQLVGEALEAGQASGMPFDPRLWLEGAPRSSHPACIAVKAAAEQGDPSRYVRRLREGFMCRRRTLDTAEALIEEARSVGEIGLQRFRVDLGSHAMLEAFGADLDRAAAVPPEHRAPDSGRARLPSLEFQGQSGQVHGVYGYADYSVLCNAALAAGAQPVGGSAPSVEEALRVFGSMATPEVAAVCQLPGPRAPAELWRLATEWRVTPERVGSGELWSLP
jgi:predicted DsbA family dithiol-disulfide isomerase